MAHRRFSELRERMTPKQRAASNAHFEAMEMHLQQLRKARQLSQEALAASLNVTQAEVSRVERSTDLYLSTLRRFVAAMGGELRIIVDFADNDSVELTQFSTPDADAPNAPA